MIDIHNHILPGIDDGAQTEDDSLAMAHAAINQGIDTIIATPHHRNGTFDNPGDMIINHVEILNELFKHLPLTVLPGQEVRMNGDMIEELKSGEEIGLNQTQYVFVEFPSRHVPHYAERMLFDVQLAGYTPIIVHPERNEELLRQPDQLLNLVQKGALTQITTGSVIGEFGKPVQKLSHELIENNLTHFVATDAHNTKSRGFTMQEAYDTIEDKYGSEMSDLFIENSQRLIDNQTIIRSEPLPFKRRKILGLF